MRKAFNIAELMISLTVVALITVLVLPIFFNTYGNKVVSAQLKKACTMITNAAKSVMTDDRSKDIESLTSVFDADTVTNEDGTTLDLGFYYSRAGVKTSNSEQGARYFLDKYFKFTKANCGSGNNGSGGSGTGDCVGASYKAEDGSTLAFPSGFYCIKTPNDSAICMRYKASTNRMEVLVDVNGSDRPNMPGSDVFVMYITNDGQLRDLDETIANCKVATAPAGEEDLVKYSAGCFHKIVSANWNMRDY